MARRKKVDADLPPCVYRQHHSFYFVDKQRKWHRLGKNLPEAMQKWATLVEPEAEIIDNTLNSLFDRYLHEVAPTKAPKTFRENQRQIKYLKAAIGHIKPDELTPVHIYQYLDIRGQKSKASTNREKSLLSHVYSMAIRWGLASDNPCKHVKRFTEKPADRYIEDWEFAAVKQLASPLLQCLMDFAYLTGLRQGDILDVKLGDLTDEGIIVQTNKTGKKLLIEWSEALRQVVKRTKNLPRPIRGMHLFCNKHGQRYSGDGIATIWQRLILKALDEGVIQHRFTFRDIRAKAASDVGLEKGTKLLGHSSPHITQKSYIRTPSKVKPVK